MDKDLKMDVARVVSLYEDTANKESPHRALVSWLWRPATLPRPLGNSHGMENQGVPKLDNNHELVGQVSFVTFWKIFQYSLLV